MTVKSQKIRENYYAKFILKKKICKIKLIKVRSTIKSRQLYDI